MKGQTRKKGEPEREIELTYRPSGLSKSVLLRERDEGGRWKTVYDLTEWVGHVRLDLGQRSRATVVDFRPVITPRVVVKRIKTGEPGFKGKIKP